MTAPRTLAELTHDELARLASAAQDAYVRIIEAAAQIRDNGKQRTLAHSTSGPCLQQNLVCVLEGGE